MIRMAASATPHRRGRKAKGNRAAISAQVPADQKPLFEEAAREAGLPLTDYIALALARYHGFPDPDYLCPKDKQQVELPISA